MAEPRIDVDGLPFGVSGPYDTVVGVDEATGAARRFPMPQPGTPRSYATLASLPAASGFAEGYTVWVNNDPNPDNNGTWAVLGGVWVQSADRVSGLAAAISTVRKDAVGVVDRLTSVDGRTLVRSDSGTGVAGSGLVVGDGGIEATSPATSWQLVTPAIGLVVENNRTSRIGFNFRPEVIDSTHMRCGLAFGEVGSRVHVNLRSDGTVYTTNDSNATQSVLSPATLAGSYAVGDTVESLWESTGDGTITLSFTTPNGVISNLSFAGSGKVWFTICVDGTVTFLDPIELEQMPKFPSELFGSLGASVSDAIEMASLSGLSQDMSDPQYGVLTRVSGTGGAPIYTSVYDPGLNGGALRLTIVEGPPFNTLNVLPTAVSSARGVVNQFDLDFSLLSNAAATTFYAGLSFGPAGAERRHVCWLETGAILVYNDAAVVQQTLVPAGSATSYADSEQVKLSVSIGVDGAATIRGSSAGLTKLTTSLPTLPAGPVWVNARGVVGSEVAFSALLKSGYSQAVADKFDSLGAGGDESAALLGWKILPDSVASRVPAGFTCTGLDRITRGAYAGCWVVADDGRLVDEGAAGPYIPAIHVLDNDFGRILMTIPGGYTGASAQGVAVDTSGAEDTVWLACGANGTLRHYHLYGANAGTEIVEDRFDWAAAGYGSNPNGLAYDSASDALWATPFAGTELRKISCNPSASPRLLATHTLGNTDPDHLHYDPESEVVYYSRGANGVDGQVIAHFLASGQEAMAYGPLSRCQAIEGIFIDRPAALLTCVSDGGFHLAANPTLNIALTYRIRLL